MTTRRLCREVALQVLYQCDTVGDWSKSCVNLCLKTFMSDLNSTDFCCGLIDGVIATLPEIDEVLTNVTENWTLERMARVDRNILRIAAFEILFRDDIPNKVSINEAIEVAKKFGADDSPNFINGVLDKVSQIPNALPLQNRILRAVNS